MPNVLQSASIFNLVTMVLSVVFLVVFFAIVHLNSCSSIITRGMIRTQEQPSQSQKPDQVIALPDPERLTSSSTDVHKKYHRIFPSFENVERTDFKRILDDGGVIQNQTGFEEIHVDDTDLKQSVPKDIVMKRILNVDEARGTNIAGENISKHLSSDKQDWFISTQSPQEISKLYWERYNNLSSEYFENSYRQNLMSDNGGKGFRDDSMWGIFQGFYSCTLTLGLMPCLQDTFREISSYTSLLQFLSPRLPRFELEESQANSDVKGGEIEKLDADQDEGRKRTKRLQLFQTLQILIPLLLALKISTLPALAVVVLVAGKAFFTSFLSLGAAIFSFFLQTPGLAANKRQEIAPQMPPQRAQDPSKYYYVM